MASSRAKGSGGSSRPAPSDEFLFAVRNAGKGLAQSPFLRYKVGDQVQCKTGMTEWSAGAIVQLYYVEPGREDDGPFPYQVRLNDGRLIFVPRDLPQLCRKVEPVWWEALFGDRWRDRATDRVRMLERLGQDKRLDQRDVNGNTALLMAAHEGWVGGVQVLVNMRADVDAVGAEGRRPLHEALTSASPSEEVVRLLLAARADPNTQDENPDWNPEYVSAAGGGGRRHRTALHYGAALGLEGACSALLEGKADPNAEDAQRKRPLHLAIEEDATKVIELLIEARADVNAGNLELGLSTTPLMDCAYHNNTGVANRLIQAQADLNAVGKQGMTALHIAARSRRENMVKLLLDSRADTSIKASGQTAADLALVNGLAGIAALITGGASESQSPAPAAAPRSVADIDPELRALLFLD